jgi:toxic protein SymE
MNASHRDIVEGLSIEPFDPDAAANWIKHYPGGLEFAG